MRTSWSLQFLIIFLTTFTVAFPWPKWLPERDSLIVARQDSSSSAKATNTQASASASASASATDNNSDSNDDNSSGTITGSATGSGSKTATGTAKETGTITKGPTTTGKSSTPQSTSANHTSYDASYPAGGVSLLTPAVASGSVFYKIGDKVTFGWNLTSLQATPTALNIAATCTTNNQLYAIANNQSVSDNGTDSVVWDTGAYQATNQSNPLLTTTYTLVIYDADSAISDTAEPGYLSVFDSYDFGMYVSQPYTGLDGWVCATCSAALGETERRALGLMVGMAVLTVASFSWFVNGLGVVW